MKKYCTYSGWAKYLYGESVDNLGDHFLIEIRGDRCFGVVGLLRGRSLFDVVGLFRGDRLCGGSMDILGDRFVIEIRVDRCFCVGLLRGRSLVW